MAETTRTDRSYWRQRAETIAREYFGANSPWVPVFLRMINQESGFNPLARSPQGASGIAQFMPATAASLGVDPWNPEQSLWGAARYLTSLANMFGGDMAKAVAAYNAGPGTVQAAVRRAGDRWVTALPDETKLYLRHVLDGGGSGPSSSASGSGVRSGGGDGAGTGTSTGTGTGTGTGGDAGPLAGIMRVIGQLLAPATQRDTTVIQEAIRTTQQQIKDLDAAIAANQEKAKSGDLGAAAAIQQLMESRNAAVRTLAALQQALRPGAGESPASLITALTGVGTLVYNMARTAFADNLDVQRFLLEVIKHSDQLAQDRFANLLALHKATTDDLQALVAARHLLQADQLAIAAQTLAWAGFISQQRAWNAVRLYQSVTGTQPGFGLDEPAAKAMQALGFTPVSPRMTAVNPEDFDPLNILKQAQQALTGTTGPLVSKVPTEEDYGIPQLQAQVAASRELAGAVPSGTSPGLSALGVPQVPDYAQILNDVFRDLGMGSAQSGGTGPAATTGQGSAGSTGPVPDYPTLVPGPEGGPGDRDRWWQEENRRQSMVLPTGTETDRDPLWQRFARYRGAARTA